MSFLEQIIGVVNGLISVGTRDSENDKFCDRKSALPNCPRLDQQPVSVVLTTTVTPTALKSQRERRLSVPSTPTVGKPEPPAPIGEKSRIS